MTIHPGREADRAWSWAPTSLYIHIPFCKSRCFYCDFTTFVAPEAAMHQYVDDLLREFEQIAPSAIAPLKTVFFGGGTPTLLSSELLTRVFEGLRQSFQLAPDVEITVEANPGTMSDAKYAALTESGVNRVSFGAQSFDPRLLMLIGRTHDVEDIIDNVQSAITAGIRRINLDLMFGLPEQTLADVGHALDAVLDLGVNHVSAYWLKVEQGTPFAQWAHRGLLPLPGEDVEADMYDLVRERLMANGLVHYEISNFARPGEEARHNLVYWRNEPYLAAGVGAHGYSEGVRYENVNNLRVYHERIHAGQRPIATTHQVDRAEAMEDTMMLGLRLQEGVSRRRFEERHGYAIQAVFPTTLPRLLARGLVEWRGDALCMTPRAWPIANAVFEEFVAEAVVH